jgi:hypothetical protein
MHLLTKKMMYRMKKLAVWGTPVPRVLKIP